MIAMAWSESGGSAGTFSPNAAVVEGTMTMTSSTAYSVELRWKTNRAADGATIDAGAGSAGLFFPTSLMAFLTDCS